MCRFCEPFFEKMSFNYPSRIFAVEYFKFPDFYWKKSYRTRERLSFRYYASNGSFGVWTGRSICKRLTHCKFIHQLKKRFTHLFFCVHVSQRRPRFLLITVERDAVFFSGTEYCNKLSLNLLLPL